MFRQICAQDWVNDRCLREFMVNNDILFKLMLDKRIPSKDAQYLLNMICYHKQPHTHFFHPSEKVDSKQVITKILTNLDEWHLRVSHLQLKLIYEQLYASTNSHVSSEVNGWLDCLARSIVEYCQQASEHIPVLDPNQLLLFTSKSTKVGPFGASNSSGSSGGLSGPSNFTTNNSNNNAPGQAQPGATGKLNTERIWLVDFLVAKLPLALQNKILRVTSQMFDASNWVLLIQPPSGGTNSKSKSFQASKTIGGGGLGGGLGSGGSGGQTPGIIVNHDNTTSALLSYPPFVALLSTCLKSKDDDKNLLLSSIYTSLSQCVTERLSDDVRAKHAVQGALQLRLAVVGAMFDVVKNSNPLIQDWTVLFLQVSFGFEVTVFGF